MGADEDVPLLRFNTHAQDQVARRQYRIATAAKSFFLLLALTTIYLWWMIFNAQYSSKYDSADTAYSDGELFSKGSSPADRLQGHLDCANRTLYKDTKLDYLKTAHPIRLSEFVDRRDRLAQALHADSLDASAVEPGYTFSYYANVTQPDWEVWEPEERPFVMLVQPIKDSSGGVKANTTFLVPSFEAERARLLHMPFPDPVQFITYEEHWNPYATLRTSGIFSAIPQPKIMVDEEMRDFISRGLRTSGNFTVHGLSGAVERVRQTKTAAELDILRAVNTGTVEALRATRKCLTPGLTENDVQYILDATLRAGGLEPFFDIVLFDEDASNPHGGTDGEAKKLEKETMVLIDVGAHLHGYSSDICRSFFPPFFPRPTNPNDPDDPTFSPDLRKKLSVFNIVLAAQSAALDAMAGPNATAASIDLAARNIIADAGYGDHFTHRVGHGIGIKAHESPYLHKGNTGTELSEGMVFAVEPGVYLEGEFGVRSEDVVVVKGQGREVDVLTGRRARSPWDP